MSKQLVYYKAFNWCSVRCLRRPISIQYIMAKFSCSINWSSENQNKVSCLQSWFWIYLQSLSLHQTWKNLASFYYFICTLNPQKFGQMFVFLKIVNRWTNFLGLTKKITFPLSDTEWKKYRHIDHLAPIQKDTKKKARQSWAILRLFLTSSETKTRLFKAFYGWARWKENRWRS